TLRRRRGDCARNCRRADGSGTDGDDRGRPVRREDAARPVGQARDQRTTVNRKLNRTAVFRKAAGAAPNATPGEGSLSLFVQHLAGDLEALDPAGNTAVNGDLDADGTQFLSR